jgi:hypothetical protein
MIQENERIKSTNCHTSNTNTTNIQQQNLPKEEKFQKAVS